MAQKSMSTASLRFADKDTGEVLVPDALTSALGKPPTSSRIEGEIMRTPKGNAIMAEDGTAQLNQFSAWHYRVADRKPGDLDGQIQELFGALTQDLSIWRALAAKFKPDLFVGFFMNEYNEGIEISVQSLTILSERRVLLDLDIYEPSSDGSGG